MCVCGLMFLLNIFSLDKGSQQMVRFLRPCEADERFSKFASLDLYAGLSCVQVEITDTLSSVAACAIGLYSIDLHRDVIETTYRHWAEYTFDCRWLVLVNLTAAKVVQRTWCDYDLVLPFVWHANFQRQQQAPGLEPKRVTA